MRLFLVSALFGAALVQANKQCIGEALGCQKCEAFAACAAYTDMVSGGGGGSPASPTRMDSIIIRREGAPGITSFAAMVDRSDPFNDIVAKTQRWFAHDGLDADSELRFHYTVDEQSLTEKEAMTLEINDDDSFFGALGLAAQLKRTLVVSAFTLTDAPTQAPSTSPTSSPSQTPTTVPTSMPTREYYTVERHVQSPGAGYTTAWKVITGFSDADPLIFTATGDGMSKVRFEHSIHGATHGGVRLRDLTTGAIFGKHDTYGFDWQTVQTDLWQKRSFQRIIQLTPGQTYKFLPEARSNTNNNDIQFHGGNEDQEYSGFWVSLSPMRENYKFTWSNGWDYYNAAWGKQMATEGDMELGKDARVLISIDMSLYGVAHGGMQFRLYNTANNAHVKTYGTHGTYGYDWQIPRTNIWTKRFDQFVWDLAGVDAGKYRFEVWIRSQGNGNRFHTHGGNEANQYSGVWFVVEEVDTYNAIMNRGYANFDTTTDGWRDVMGWSEPFETRTGKMCFQASLSIYGRHHGGCKLVNDQGAQWGDQGRYGLDWMIVTDNVWEKRGFLRALDVEPNKAARYKLQCQPQGQGHRFHMHSGDANANYSGQWFTLEEC